MDEHDDSSLKLGLVPGTEDPNQVSFNEAARFLGLDTFTFYAVVQRDEIPYALSPWGEFVVSRQELDSLAIQKE
jgi:hypothetical protein